MAGVRKILVTGMSGVGKSTALAALGRLGFHVVDTDSPDWSEWSPSADDRAGEWLWREDRIAELLAADEVILDRIGRRTTNDYGKAPAERALVLHHLESVEPRLRATCTHEIDAGRPLEEVVDALVAIATSA